MKQFLCKVLILVCVVSCNETKKDINMNDSHVSHNQKELKKYINIDTNIKECTFEFSMRTINSSRISVGTNDYQLYAVLEYEKEDFIKIVEKIQKYNKRNDVYLEVNKIPKWFPDGLVDSFTKEGEYYHLVNSYEPNLFLSKENPLFVNGFCYIGNNETYIIIFLHSLMDNAQN